MKVLFVCTGNTCRSVMAEAIFNSISETEDIKAYSAGVSPIPGSIASSHAAELVVNNLNQNISSRKAVQLTEEMLKETDLILTMTEYIRDVINFKYPAYSHKVYALNQYVGEKGDIIDPYGGSVDVYKKTYKDLENKIFLLFKKIKGDRGL